MKNVILTFLIFFYLFVIPCYADGLDTLIEIGKGQGEMQKALDEETKAFTRVKNAIETGAVSKGQAKAAIEDRYGEPVVITQDSATKREKWVYKPSASSFFKGIKVYLFFDANNMLDEIRIVGHDKEN